MSAHLAEWQIFSVRYGVHDYADPVWSDKMPWAARHKAAPATELHRCVCAGVRLGSGQCSQSMTQEDLRCDECRAWCVQVDRRDNFSPIPAVSP